jgi:predicted nucleic acid-binding protein
VSDYLVDNSVWSRLVLGDQTITARLRRIERAPSDLLVTCPPQVLEFCHSARTPEEHALHRSRICLGFPLERAPDESLVLDLQSRLWSKGLVRAAGAVDILIAGYAIVNDAIVLASDHDFCHIATVSDLRHEYIAPSR